MERWFFTMQTIHAIYRNGLLNPIGSIEGIMDVK